MSSRVMELVKAARERGEPAGLAELVPFARMMGISLTLQGGELLGVMKFGEHLIGNPMLPALHGGAICALLESTAIFQLLWDGEFGAPPKTIGLTVEYLRSGRAVDTFARGVPTLQGRRVARVRVEAWQDDRARPIAAASAHFLVGADEH